MPNRKKYHVANKGKEHDIFFESGGRIAFVQSWDVGRIENSKGEYVYLDSDTESLISDVVKELAINLNKNYNKDRN